MVQMLCVHNLTGASSQQYVSSEVLHKEDTTETLSAHQQKHAVDCNEEHQHVQGLDTWASRLFYGQTWQSNDLTQRQPAQSVQSSVLHM